MVLRTPDDLVMYDVASRQRWESTALADEALSEVLTFCEQWQEHPAVAQLVVDLAGVDKALAEDAIMRLVDVGLLVMEEDEAMASARSGARRWREKGWEDPFYYQWHTNLLPCLDYSSDLQAKLDMALMRAYVAEEPQPDFYKVLNDEDAVPLPRDVEVPQPSFADLLSRPSGTSRRFDPLTLDDFSWITSLAYGQTAVKRIPVTGDHVAKTSPSGGSRHPTEVYPLVFRVRGLEAGLYHYRVKDHALEPMKLGDHVDFMREHIVLHSESPSFVPAVVYIYSSLFDRSMFRYRESRSYRIINFDLGHLMQTTTYLAGAIGRPVYKGYALHDSAVDAFLGIDGITEATMAYIVVG